MNVEPPVVAPLAPYASMPDQSRGRLHKEPESPSRTPFQRDRDRITHSTAFRRLQYKTQVFVYHEGDHYRTRLTHSLEVAQIARSLARALDLNEDLEEALDQAMRQYGGFSHNDQTLRILTSLEHRYADFDGLNLTWETLEGTVKHNGPIKSPLSETIAGYNAQHDLALDTWPSAEAQAAALSDDIAYDNHDIDDGFRAGLFTLDDLRDVPLIGPLLAEVRARNRKIEDSRLIHEAIRRLIDRMVSDVVGETQRRIVKAGIGSPTAVRQQSAALVSFSDAMRDQEKGLRAFLFERMYRHYRVNRMSSKARRIVAELFEIFTREPDCLPTEWRELTDKNDPAKTARIVADYIAGMTDRFALDEHRRLFDEYRTT